MKLAIFSGENKLERNFGCRDGLGATRNKFWLLDDLGIKRDYWMTWGSNGRINAVAASLTAEVSAAREELHA